MTNKKSPKIAFKFYCEKCDYKCYKKSEWVKHTSTRKHKIRTNTNEKSPKISKSYECECGKSYKHVSSLWNHKKTCKYSTQTKEQQIPEPTLEYLLKENIEMKKENIEMKKMMIDLCKKIEPVSNNTNINSNNNNIFNIQLFLNENCKDAMNMTEFIESIQLSIEDVEKIGIEGQTRALSNILVSKLNDLDIVKRPVHCSDIKKEIIYVKDEDKWEQETHDNPNLKRALDKIADESMCIIPNNTDSSSKIVSEILKHPREDDVIVSEVSKNIVINDT